MKVVIFGGGGFIGSAVTDRLLAQGHAIRIFERSDVTPYRSFGESESVEWIKGDFLNSSHVMEAIDQTDVVVHLVSTTLPMNSNVNPVYDVQSNIVATLQLLGAMVERNVKKIVFISSGGTVYGKPRYTPINETHPTDPLVSYGITKLAIEKYLLMYQHLHAIKPVILRVANPFGERQRVATAQGAVGVFLHRALKREQINVWGDGSVTRDYVHISDVADAFLKAIEYSGQESIFNIGSGRGTTLNELLVTIEKCLGTDVARHYSAGRSFDVPVNVLDISLAVRELGWRPQVSLQDGITRTIQWMTH